jgi:hypothetical protein
LAKGKNLKYSSRESGLLQPQIITAGDDNVEMKIIQYPSDISKSHQSPSQPRDSDIANSEQDVNLLLTKMNTLNAICDHQNQFQSF